ncbi:hypothetical protein ACJIZ3_003856 [Penstemon smallii]|uniref:Uncharacterized protein n=1 Tax=Penstemon smallii TaxID=265156 RepID=A0ABD3S0H1_9LAMI
MRGKIQKDQYIYVSVVDIRVEPNKQAEKELSVIKKRKKNGYQKVWAAITLVRSIGNCPVVFNLLDLSGSIKACKNAALKCDEFKFEQYKLSTRDRLTADIQQHMQNCLEKIKLLEHLKNIQVCFNKCKAPQCKVCIILSLGFVLLFGSN